MVLLCISPGPLLWYHLYIIFKRNVSLYSSLFSDVCFNITSWHPVTLLLKNILKVVVKVEIAMVYSMYNFVRAAYPIWEYGRDVCIMYLILYMYKIL